VFCLQAKDVPVEKCELPDTVTTFAWEPKGDRFSIVHGTAGAVPNFSIHELNIKTSKLEKLITVSSNDFDLANNLHTCEDKLFYALVPLPLTSHTW
jgi:translation initiation factor 3 subunit B